MNVISTGIDRGTLVALRDIRDVAMMSKVEFDTAIFALAQQGLISLHRHDFPKSLSQSERDEMVTDNQGNYYVGVAIRQSNWNEDDMSYSI